MHQLNKDLLHVVIIDDEKHSRNALRYFIENGYPGARITGEADSVKSGIHLLNTLTPDILLLDVNMEDGTGFDLIDHFPDATFRVIFITAFDTYAVKAFRYNALDYLLKPFDQQDLFHALTKACNPVKAPDRLPQMDQMKKKAAKYEFDRITLNLGNRLLFALTHEITHIEANGNYSFVHFENGERHLVAQPIGSFSEMLDGDTFFRTHQSHIINIRFARMLLKDDGEYVKLMNNALVPLAKRRKDDFVLLMKGMTNCLAGRAR